MHPPVNAVSVEYFSMLVNVWFSPPSLVTRSQSPRSSLVVPTRPPDALIHHFPCPKSCGFIFACHSSGVTLPASTWHRFGPNRASHVGLSQPSTSLTFSPF